MEIREQQWQELCRKASHEPDPQKLLHLVEQINQILDQREIATRGTPKQ